MLAHARRSTDEWNNGTTSSKSLSTTIELIAHIKAKSPR
ncbi:hypothetical protein LPU83_pLPU83c_0351 (plasmid) [Rhizobium favelukesii]|uniref:Uncharacterized protein n=1 Tax=Rhizobium favelukesii TaxID=348824 RepID=W6RPY4_9HYPH|nr:hypothetical protein LPU83_pLPU83c_0351 [Rhizobium favelukesii]